MNATIDNLRRQLHQFGLNPSEWALEIKGQIGKRLRIGLVSREGLELEGLALRQGWLSLSLHG